MRLSSRGFRSLLSRLLVVPAVVGLVLASVLVGYAGDEIWGHHSLERARMARRVLTAWLAPQEGDEKGSDYTGQNSDPLEDYKTALNLLKKDYYGPPVDAKKTRQLTYEAIQGMLDTLKDQFTSFLNPDDWSQMQATTRGDFEGIGALLQQEPPNNGAIKVVRPIETGPAEKAGLKADDVIVRVNGKPILGKDLNEVVNLIKGKSGTYVRLGVMRGKTPLDFTIRRALVEPPVVKYWMEDKENKIGHIVLTDFNEKSIEQMERAFASLESQGMRALVFDLRYNPGGLLTVAIDVASLFIPPDQNKDLDNAVVYIKEGTGKEQAMRLKEAQFTHRQVPMVVLTNGMSASASEIVAGAIKDYGVGTLMGERTFGKGLVQSLFQLGDHSALRLTTAKYYTPKHTDINRKRDEDGDPIPGSGGIVPDIEVKQSKNWKEEDFKDKTNDVQLQKALQFLRARLNGKTIAQAAQEVTQTP
ncbi:MAG TPA: S41 family peptidase [Chthonomonadaceae bacterium]|nr:S41 family peptidase [Chthonomonadaceae bacterium]